MNIDLKRSVRISDQFELPKKITPTWNDVGYLKDMAEYAEKKGKLIQVSNLSETGKWAGLVAYKDGSQWWWPLHMLEN